MYCSVKFLSPSVTAGLPLPGCDDEPDALVLLDVLDLLELPQAASESASAAAMSAGIALCHVRVVTVSSSWVGCSGKSGLRRGAASGGVRLQLGVVDAR